MRVYLAGPMRRLPEYNFPAFREATKLLTDRGHEVFSPAARDEATGFDTSGMTGSENLAEYGFDIREAIAVDVSWIARYADIVVVLPGWETSLGVAAEMATAAAIGIPVTALATFLTEHLHVAA